MTAQLCHREDPRGVGPEWVGGFLQFSRGGVGLHLLLLLFKYGGLAQAARLRPGPPSSHRDLGSWALDTVSVGIES